MKRTVKTVEYVIERRRTLFAGKNTSTAGDKCTSCGRPYEPLITEDNSDPKLIPAEAAEKTLEKI